MKPKSIFVAHFIGESNFLEGYVSTVGKRGSTIMLRGEVKIETVQKDVEEGERVVLALRPETLLVDKGIKKDENSVLGAIERTTFEGTDIRYEVRLENQDMVVVVKPSLMQEWLDVGEKVTVSFSPSRLHVFAYPKVGLREELAVE